MTMTNYDIYPILIGIIVSFGSLCLQTWPRLKNKWFGVDTWRHLAAADSIRKTARLPQANEKYIFPEPSDYPPLLRVLIALVPCNIVKKYQWIISPLFDFIHSFIVFLAGWVLTGSAIAGIIAQLTYITSPLVVMENSSLTTRSFSSFLSTLTFFTFIYYLTTFNVFILFVSFCLGIALIMTHRFSLQAFFFFSVALSIYSVSLLPLIFLVTCFFGAVVLTKGYSWRVFTGHLQMLEFWRRNIHNRYAHQVRGNDDNYKDSSSAKKRDIVFTIYNHIRKAPFLAVLSANPSCIIGIFVAILGVFHSTIFEKIIISNTVWPFILLWTVVLTFVGICIRQFKFIEFIGEGERYQDSGMFPSSIIAAGVGNYLLINGYQTLAIYIFLTLWIAGLSISIYLQYAVVYKDNGRSITKELWDIFDIINNEKKEVRIMTIPLLLADSVMYFTKAKVVSTDSSVAHLKHYSDFFPVLKKNIKDFANEYNLTHVIVNTDFVDFKELSISEEYFSVAYKGHFCLLKVQDKH